VPYGRRTAAVRPLSVVTGALALHTGDMARDAATTQSAIDERVKAAFPVHELCSFKTERYGEPS